MIAAGHKQAFCLVDIENWAWPELGNGDPTYTCINQGISVGWLDVYDRFLDCQWIDVTGVPYGDYTLRIEVNLPPVREIIAAKMPRLVADGTVTWYFLFAAWCALYIALTQQLRARATDDEATIARRLANARRELELTDRYDKQLMNANLDRAVDDLVTLLIQMGCGG